MSGNPTRVPAGLGIASNLLAVVGAGVGWYSVSHVLRVADSASGHHLADDLNGKKMAAVTLGAICIMLILLAVKTGKRWLVLISLLLDGGLVRVLVTQTSTMKVSALFGLNHSVGYWVSLITVMIACLSGLWLLLKLGKVRPVSLEMAVRSTYDATANPMPNPVVVPTPAVGTPVMPLPPAPQAVSLPATPPAPAPQVTQPSPQVPPTAAPVVVNPVVQSVPLAQPPATSSTPTPPAPISLPPEPAASQGPQPIIIKPTQPPTNTP